MAVWTIAPASTAGSLPKLQKLAHAGATISALVVDLDNDKTIAGMNPRLRLTPASLTKLVTAAAAFSHWHADHPFTTRLLLGGPVDDDTLDGNLILQGGGDATLDDTDLWSLVAQLRSAGIRQIDGNLVIVPAPFGPIACATKDRCDALKSSDTAYDAEVSSIGIDFGTWCVTVHPTKAGKPARISACATARVPIPISGTITTVPAGRSPSFWIERRTDDSGDHLQIAGNIPAGRTRDIYRAMSNPARGTGRVLAEMLHEMGVDLSGKVIVATDTDTDKAPQIASVQSEPLRAQLDGMLRYSNNYIADVTTLDLAATGPAAARPASLAEAATTLQDFVRRSNLKRGDDANPTPRLDSGSGLTPSNLLSAQDLVNVLATMYHDSRRFPAFYGGLVVPREAPFRFLRLGNDDWLDRVALKTGTLNDPHSVFGIAGYMRKEHGGWMAFAIIVNGNKHHHHIPLYKSLAAARGDIQTILSKH